MAPGSVSLSCTYHQHQGSSGDSSDSGGGSVEVRCAFLLRPGEEQQGEAPIEEGVGVGEVCLPAVLLVAAAARWSLSPAEHSKHSKHMSKSKSATCTLHLPLHSPASCLACAPCLKVGGAHWLSESQPTTVNVAAAEDEAAGRTEGSIRCKATYTGTHCVPPRCWHCFELSAALGRVACKRSCHLLAARHQPYPHTSCRASLFQPHYYFLPLCAAVGADGSVMVRWEVDASDALPATLAPGLEK